MSAPNPAIERAIQSALFALFTLLHSFVLFANDSENPNEGPVILSVFGLVFGMMLLGFDVSQRTFSLCMQVHLIVFVTTIATNIVHPLLPRGSTSSAVTLMFVATGILFVISLLFLPILSEIANANSARYDFGDIPSSKLFGVGLGLIEESLSYLVGFVQCLRGLLKAHPFAAAAEQTTCSDQFEPDVKIQLVEP